MDKSSLKTHSGDMRKKAVVIACMIAAITGLAWMVLCHSTPAVSLLVIRYETNTIPDLNWTIHRAWLRLTNSSSRPIFYLGDLNLEPYYKSAVLTEKGWVDGNAGKCGVGSDNWAVSANRSTDFSVILGDPTRTMRVSVEYTQSQEVLGKIGQALPKLFSQHIPWLSRKRIAKTVLAGDKNH
jgi:hypothetical protein